MSTVLMFAIVVSVVEESGGDDNTCTEHKRASGECNDVVCF
jgi:hypothetical protein